MLSLQRTIEDSSLMLWTADEKGSSTIVFPHVRRKSNCAIFIMAPTTPESSNVVIETINAGRNIGAIPEASCWRCSVPWIWEPGYVVHAQVTTGQAGWRSRACQRSGFFPPSSPPSPTHRSFMNVESVCAMPYHSNMSRGLRILAYP